MAYLVDIFIGAGCWAVAACWGSRRWGWIAVVPSRSSGLSKNDPVAVARRVWRRPLGRGGRVARVIPRAAPAIGSTSVSSCSHLYLAGLRGGIVAAGLGGFRVTPRRLEISQARTGDQVHDSGFAHYRMFGSLQRVGPNSRLYDATARLSTEQLFAADRGRLFSNRSMAPSIICW